MFQTQKLADGKCICRKNCRSRGFRAFDYVHGTLPQINAHLAQVDYNFFIFGKSTRACVYRIADLIGYDMEETEVKTSNGTEKKIVMHLSFAKTEGMCEFTVPLSDGQEFNRICNYFDTLFGIQKTLGNAMNNWNRQTAAIKSVASGIKAAMNGAENIGEKAADAAGALDAAIYGDRTDLIRRADTVLAAFPG